MRIIKLTLGALDTNCYILYDPDTKEAAVIDPADEETKIIDTINNYNLKVKYIIITHAHIDHLLALDKVYEYTNASVVIHFDDKDALNNDVFNLASFFNAKSPLKKADITVKNGDILPLGENTLTFIHTPGHNRGSMCIHTDNILISGDTLFNLSIGRTDYYGGNFDTIINSIKKRLFVLDDDTKVYPGHGQETTIGYEIKNNPFIR
ncbi:MAG: MBL fold metallo-hydrolase [Ruminococcaceae bacterium]|nr:MBL fold metallo-hydrolase [Oscillospiraceae bacterium]